MITNVLTKPPKNDSGIKNASCNYGVLQWSRIILLSAENLLIAMEVVKTFQCYTKLSALNVKRREFCDNLSFWLNIKNNNEMWKKSV